MFKCGPCKSPIVTRKTQHKPTQLPLESTSATMRGFNPLQQARKAWTVTITQGYVMAIRVFVSHQSKDRSLASHVALQLRLNGLDAYVDVIDDALVKDGPELADHLLARMSECQQLMAVVSKATKQSWWVPWEIGVGSEKGFRISSYSEQLVTLPSYLKKWPQLHSDADIAEYCNLSKEIDQRIGSRKRLAVLSEQAQLEVRKSYASDFHARLKVRLGQ